LTRRTRYSCGCAASRAQETALTGRLEAERYARALEEHLAERNREIQELTEDRNRLRATLDAEYARVIQEIDKLSQDLALARSRSDRADRRCAELEAVLDLMDQAHSDQHQDADVPPAVPQADWGGIASRALPLDDPYAVADFLSLLDRLGLRDPAGKLADRFIVHFSDRRHSLGDMMKQDGLLPLLATMNRLRFYEQADMFSGLLGYTSYRRLRRNSSVGGRFS
jgi:hypothetical protein